MPRIVDLSLEIYHGAPTFPWDPKCGVLVHNTIDSIGYNITQLIMSTHQGTHLDAPFHFLRDGTTVDRLPLDRLVGPAFLVDLTALGPRTPMRVEDFVPYADRIGPGARIAVRTDWDRRFPDPAYFTDMPYVTVELADWLARRRIAVLALDIPTPCRDHYPEVHELLLADDGVVIEGLANLSEIAVNPFTLVALPLKLRGRDGSPIRAVAIEGDLTPGS